MKPAHDRVLKVLGLCLFLFLYAPIVVVMTQSFNSSRYGVSWKGFTWEWYGKLFENEGIRAAAINTLVLAVSSTAISTVLGSALAYGMGRFQWRWRRALEGLIQAPVYIPDVVAAAGFLVFFGVIRGFLPGFEPGLRVMILAHATVQLPFVTLVVRARMSGFDRTLEEAAHDLGANGWEVFREVTGPFLFPGVMSGALLAFTLSLDDFVVSFFTSGPGTSTLPMLIYSSVKRGVTPEINALSTLLVVLSALAAWFAMRLGHGDGKKTG